MKFKKWYICLSILLFKNLRNMQDEGIWCTFEKERKQAIVCIFSLSIFILTRFLVNCRRPCEDKCSRVRTNGNSLTNILITNRLDNLTSCGENIRLKYRIIFVTVAERRLKSLELKIISHRGWTGSNDDACGTRASVPRVCKFNFIK